MWWLRWLRLMAAVAFVLFLGLTASQAFAFTQDGNPDNDPTGKVFPSAEAAGDDFLAGAHGFDESVQAVLPLGKSMSVNVGGSAPIQRLS